MRVVNQPVENRVSKRWIADGGMPTVDRNLAGYDRRTLTVPVVEHLKQITPRRIRQRPHGEVVHDEDVGLRPLREQLCVTAATMCDGHFLVELRHAQIAG